MVRVQGTTGACLDAGKVIVYLLKGDYKPLWSSLPLLPTS